MIKVAQVLADIEGILSKQAFIPNPQKDPRQQQGQGGGMEQLLSQLPPEIAQQIQQLPPEQQQQALQQIMQQAQGGPSEGPGQAGGGEQGPDINPATLAGGGNDPQAVTTGNAPPTDLQNSTITLRVQDLLDLVSGGKATQSTLKVKEFQNKQDIRNQQLQQKAEADAQKQQQKQEQEAQQQAQMGMLGQPGGMTGGGVY